MRNLAYALTAGFLVSLPFNVNAFMQPKYVVAEGVPERKRQTPKPYVEKPKLAAIIRREEMVIIEERRSHCYKSNRVGSSMVPFRSINGRYDRRIV